MRFVNLFPQVRKGRSDQSGKSDNMHWFHDVRKVGLKPKSGKSDIYRYYGYEGCAA